MLLIRASDVIVAYTFAGIFMAAAIGLMVLVWK
jgi:hypothetical protein